MEIDGKSVYNVHFRWDGKLEPIARIKQGDWVKITVPDSSVNQILPGMTEEDMGKIDESKFDGAVGPLFIEGAKAGQTLKIEFESIETGEYGWSAIIDNFGLLKNMFRRKLITWKKTSNVWEVEDTFLKGIRIRNRPFLGVVGTAPKEGTYGMIPPQVFGGNMDTKTICTGSILMLPVNVDGALVSFGDPHGSQGDGEVCGTAIETEATIKVRFSTVEESIKRPMIISEEYSTGRTISASGISEDLHIAAQMAVLDMIKYLMKRGLSGQESYILLSVIGNLAIREIVDEPNFVVTMSLPMELIDQIA